MSIIVRTRFSDGFVIGDRVAMDGREYEVLAIDYWKREMILELVPWYKKPVAWFVAFIFALVAFTASLYVLK